MADADDLSRAARAIEEFLRAVGAPVDADPELRETGRRVAEAFANELLSGYGADPAAILQEATSSDAPGMVLVTSIATATTCPHHLMPATGVAHVGYLPGARVVGLRQLARLVDCFARRLILQEELGRSVARARSSSTSGRAPPAWCSISRRAASPRGASGATAPGP
ncbi:MAG: GTP cyclohydrolase I [Sandaracinaceae bacterium]|nr:GTP cyclohydrolase I [Sandaracinaceae bacterium]